jgi:hypothetical protein
MLHTGSKTAGRKAKSAVPSNRSDLRVSVEIAKAPMDSRVSASIYRNRVIRGYLGGRQCLERFGWLCFAWSA